MVADQIVSTAGFTMMIVGLVTLVAIFAYWAISTTRK